MKICGVYRIIHTATGRGYVGHSVDVRARIGHHFTVRKSRSPIDCAIRKYGRSQFTWELLERCADKTHAAQREQYWIRHLETKAPRGFNLTDGGDGGLAGMKRPPFSEAHRAQLRTNLGRKLSAEEQARLSASVSRALKGKPLSAAHKAKLAQAQREHLARVGGHSAEVRAKLAAAHKGKPKASRGKPLSTKALAARRSPERLAKWRAAMRVRWGNP